MPYLPTFNPGQLKYDRVMAAFGGEENYREWLRFALISELIVREGDRIRNEADVAIVAKREEIKNVLGDIS